MRSFAWPLASVIDPNVSLDAMLPLLLYATKLSEPLLSVTLGFSAALPLVNRPNVVEPLLGMLMAVLSTVRAPPWPADDPVVACDADGAADELSSEPPQAARPRARDAAAIEAAIQRDFIVLLLAAPGGLAEAVVYRAGGAPGGGEDATRAGQTSDDSGAGTSVRFSLAPPSSG